MIQQRHQRRASGRSAGRSRTTARILDAYAGYDPEGRADRLQRRNRQAGQAAVREVRDRRSGASTAIRIGVVREYMDKSLFTIADSERSTSSTRRSTTSRPSARRSSTRSERRAVPGLRRQVLAGLAQPTVHGPVLRDVPGQRDRHADDGPHRRRSSTSSSTRRLVPKNCEPDSRASAISALRPGDSGGGEYNWNVYLARAGRRGDPDASPI
jgi:hypothetical protein